MRAIGSVSAHLFPKSENKCENRDMNLFHTKTVHVKFILQDAWFNLKVYVKRVQWSFSHLNTVSDQFDIDFRIIIQFERTDLPWFGCSKRGTQSLVKIITARYKILVLAMPIQIQ